MRAALGNDSRPTRLGGKIMLACCLLLAGQGLAPVRAASLTWTGAAGNSNWFATNNWSTTNVPADGDTATITNGTVLLTSNTAALSAFTLTNATLIFSNWDTRLSATNVAIWNRGTVTVANAFSNSVEMSNRVWIVGSNLTLATGGVINVTGLGFKTGCGPGCSPVGAGASYGGRGGFRTTTAPTTTYGFVQAPTQPGSGSASGSSASGGGAVRVAADGAVEINGNVTANGMAGGGTWHGGSSGGAIFISCQSFGGAGSLQANGGNGMADGGGGGGGRIAVIFTNTTGTVGVRFSAARGNSVNSFSKLAPEQAQMGSLYLSSTNALGGMLAAADAWQNQVQCAYLYLESDPGGFTSRWSAASLTLSNVFLGLPDDYRLEITNDLLVATNSGLFLGSNGVIICSNLLMEAGASLFLGSNSVIVCSNLVMQAGANLHLLAGANLTCSGAVSMASGTVAVVREQSGWISDGDVLLDGASLTLWTNPVFRCGGSLTLTNSSSLTIYSGPTNITTSYGALLGVTNTLTVASNCWIYPDSDYTNGGSALLQVGEIIIHANGGINANGRGFGFGPGYSSAPAGASHGGRGGYRTTTAPTTTYGSAQAPLTPGSGTTAARASGCGGGAVRVEAAGAAVLDGLITAGGTKGGGTYCGGGSGGAIYLCCAHFSGRGSLRANGGDGQTDSPDGGGGGGGRIAVWVNMPVNIKARYILTEGNSRGVLAATNWPESGGAAAVDPGLGCYNPPDDRAAQPGTVFFFKYAPGGMFKVCGR